MVFAAVGLLLPQLGPVLAPTVPFVLALMVFCMSLTISLADIAEASKRPVMLALAAFLAFIPMPLAGLALGRLFFTNADLATGQLLIGSVPTDISAPLMVYLAGGKTAMGVSMLVVVMVLTPLLSPLLLRYLGGVTFSMPLGNLMGELFLIIVVPVAVGVALRTRYFSRVRRYEPVYSAAASLCYLWLLLTVISGSSTDILALGIFGGLVLLAQIIHNLLGYLFALSARFLAKDLDELSPTLFTVSNKEFGIAAALAFASGMPKAVVLPSIFFAVVQMITSPLAAKAIRRWRGASDLAVTRVIKPAGAP